MPYYEGAIDFGSAVYGPGGEPAPFSGLTAYDAVGKLQEKIGEDADGRFGACTDAALRRAIEKSNYASLLSAYAAGGPAAVPGFFASLGLENALVTIHKAWNEWLAAAEKGASPATCGGGGGGGADNGGDGSSGGGNDGNGDGNGGREEILRPGGGFFSSLEPWQWGLLGVVAVVAGYGGYRLWKSRGTTKVRRRMTGRR